MAVQGGDGHEAGHPKQSARGLAAIAEDPFEGQAQQMGIANQFSRQSAVHAGYGAVPFVRALFVLAPDQLGADGVVARGLFGPGLTDDCVPTFAEIFAEFLLSVRTVIFYLHRNQLSEWGAA